MPAQRLHPTPETVPETPGLARAMPVAADTVRIRAPQCKVMGSKCWSPCAASHLQEHHEAHTRSIQHRAAIRAVDATRHWLLLLKLSHILGHICTGPLGFWCCLGDAAVHSWCAAARWAPCVTASKRLRGFGGFRHCHPSVWKHWQCRVAAAAGGSCAVTDQVVGLVIKVVKVHGSHLST